MTGREYAELVAAYIAERFADRGVVVYREVYLGKSIIGKNRRVDVFVHIPDEKTALAIECKFQEGQGTADEKIPYALNDASAMWAPAFIAYAGEGFSEGVLHLLQSSEYAAYCLPDPENLISTPDTKELDHILASVFGWWDIVLSDKTPFDLTHWKSSR